jgi:hypothetical protein
MPVWKIKFVSDRATVIFYVTHHSGQSAATYATDRLGSLRLSSHVGRRDIEEITELGRVTTTYESPGIIDYIKLIG